MLRQVMTSCKHKDCNYHDDDGDGKNSDDDDDGNDDDNEDGDEVEGRARRKAAAGRDQSGLTESCWGQSLLPCLPQRATKNVIISILLIIINTRPKPPSGRPGLAGSWGKDTVRQVHYKMFSMSHFAPTALSSNWILLFKCGYKNSLVITKIFYFLLSTFYFLSEDKPLQTNKQTDRPFKKVIIFRYRQTHTSS